jgi:hypothetical protein
LYATLTILFLSHKITVVVAGFVCPKISKMNFLFIGMSTSVQVRQAQPPVAQSVEVSMGFFLPSFFITLRHQGKSERLNMKKALFPRLSFAGRAV